MVKKTSKCHKSEVKFISVKISDKRKEDVRVLKMITNKKFDYEMIDVVFDFYINNLSKNDYEKYKKSKEMI